MLQERKEETFLQAINLLIRFNVSSSLAQRIRALNLYLSIYLLTAYSIVYSIIPIEKAGWTKWHTKYTNTERIIWDVDTTSLSFARSLLLKSFFKWCDAKSSFDQKHFDDSQNVLLQSETKCRHNMKIMDNDKCVQMK